MFRQFFRREASIPWTMCLSMCYLLTILLKFVRKSAILSYSHIIFLGNIYSLHISATQQSSMTSACLVAWNNLIQHYWFCRCYMRLIKLLACEAPLFLIMFTMFYMTNHTFYISLRSSTKFGVMFHSVELWLNKSEVLICVNCIAKADEHHQVITFIKLKLS